MINSIQGKYKGGNIIKDFFGEMLNVKYNTIVLEIKYNR